MPQNHIYFYLKLGATLLVMASYYIKEVHPPIPENSLNAGQECNLHFTEESRAYCNKFADCAHFLVYATGRTEDGKHIFARGRPTTPWCKNVWETDPREVDGIQYPLAVEVEIEKRVPVGKGVSLTEIKRLCPRLKNHTFQARGGLIAIDKDEFEILSAELDKCSY